MVTAVREQSDVAQAVAEKLVGVLACDRFAAPFRVVPSSASYPATDGHHTAAALRVAAASMIASESGDAPDVRFSVVDADGELVYQFS